MTDVVTVEKVRIRWGLIRDCGPIPPFEGIIVEDLAGNRIQDIPTEHTPAVVHAVVGQPITITQFVRENGKHVLDRTKTEVTRKSLTLLVVANEIPEAKREEIISESPH